MDLGVLVTLSCVFTSIAMVLIIGFLVILARSGGQGIASFVDNILGRGDDSQPQPEGASARQRGTMGADGQQVANSQSLRQRARNLDFPAPNQAQAAAITTGSVLGANAVQAQSAQQTPSGSGRNIPDFPPMQQQSGAQSQGNQFGTQSAQPQQPSLRPRGQYPEFNPQAQQGGNSGFQPSTPSLSPSRPFNAGGNAQFPQSQGGNQQNQFRGQQRNQNQFGNQQQNQFGNQQQGNLNAQGQRPPQFNQQGNQNQFGNQQQQNQFGNQQQGNFNAQRAGGQRPPQFNQGGQQGNQNQFGNQQRNQSGNQQQGNLNAQGQRPPQFNPQNPNQGQFNNQNPQGQNQGLGQNRPSLRSRPRPSDTYIPQGSVGNARDRRRGDDYDRIYDDGGDNGNNIVDEVGDFIDNF